MPSIIGLLAAALTTAAYVPQVLHTWRSRNADGLSLPMLLLFITGLVLWLTYGIMLNDLPMILANTVTLTLAGSLLVFKLFIYRK